MDVRKIFQYLFRNILKLVTLLLAVSILAFTLVSLSPIDPVKSYVGADMTRVSEEQRENIAAYWGLDEPKVNQYVNWLTSVVQGELGTSLLYRSPVSDVIAERFLNSFALMGLAWVLSGIFGFILGAIAGVKSGTWIDKSIKTYCYMLASTPTFWLGLVLLMIFAVGLGWFPIGLSSPAGILSENVTFLERVHHLLLPALTLSIVGVSNIALHTRQKLIDVYQSDYVRYGMAKGERGFTLFFRHGLRNTMLPAISIHFASFGELFGGAILAEQVFSYPGLGQAVTQAGLGGDVPLLLGIVLFSTIFVFFGNFIADMLYKIVDPRIRRGMER